MELCVDVLSNIAGIDVGVDYCSGHWSLRRGLLIVRDAVDVWRDIGVGLDTVEVSLLLVLNLHGITELGAEIL